MPSFVLCLCHPGAESALKRDAAIQGLRPAFQARGLVTLKHDDELPPSFQVRSPLARFSALSIGRARLDEARARAGTEGALLHEVFLEGPASPPSARPRVGQRVLTLMRATAEDPEPGWLTAHVHDANRSVFPGNRPVLALPADAPSRAWLKIEEARARFALDLGAGARVLEIGSAPGGASWALLQRGCTVVGMDPNEMAPSVLRHPGFRHVRQASTTLDPASVPGPFDWLLLDVNVPPGTALRGAMPFIEAHASTLRGLALTLKLGEWDFVKEAPGWVERIRQRVPHLRLTAYSGWEHAQEIGVVATRAL